MRRKLGVLLATAGLVFACTPMEPAPVDPLPEADALTDYVDKAVATERFRGAVEVRRGAEVLLRRGFGRADPVTGVPNGPNTRFRIASVTKQFTGLAVLLLQERGELGVTDPVCYHLPACPPHWASITIHQLLTHTAGLHNYADDLRADPARFFATLGTETPSPDQLVQLIAGYPPDAPPGTVWAYSNSGYVLLGKVIEQVSGKRYGDFLRDELLDPLGMSNTGYGPAPGEEYAVGYEDWETPAPVLSDGLWFAAGGLYSTVTDLGRWQRFLLTGDPAAVKEYTLAELLAPRVVVAQNATTWYGYGIVAHGPTMADIDSFAHSGGIPGFNSYVEIYPETGVSVTVLANITINPEQFGRDLAALVPPSR